MDVNLLGTCGNPKGVICTFTVSPLWPITRMQSCEAESVKMRRPKCEDATAKGRRCGGQKLQARRSDRACNIAFPPPLFRIFYSCSFLNSLLLSVRMNYLFCSKLFQACFSVFYSSFFPVNISAQKSWNSHGPISPCILISTIRSSASGYISPVCIDSYYFSSEMIFRELSRFLERVEILKKGK